MSTLGINSYVKSGPSSSSHFRFSLFSSQNSFFFLQPTKPISEKRWSQTHSVLDHDEILAARLKPNSENSHRWELQKLVGAKRNTLHTVAFSFLAETKNIISQIPMVKVCVIEFLKTYPNFMKIQRLTKPRS